MSTALHWTVVVGLSIPGVWVWRRIWRMGMPERYVKPRIPDIIDDVPITLDSDIGGLV